MSASCVCSSPAERAYEISHSGPASRPEERENSIFVAALKEHVQKGTLDTRVDRLLTEAAEGVLQFLIECVGQDTPSWCRAENMLHMGPIKKHFQRVSFSGTINVRVMHFL